VSVPLCTLQGKSEKAVGGIVSLTDCASTLGAMDHYIKRASSTKDPSSRLAITFAAIKSQAMAVLQAAHWIWLTSRERLLIFA
jgi:hypothetical protein